MGLRGPCESSGLRVSGRQVMMADVRIISKMRVKQIKSEIIRFKRVMKSYAKAFLTAYPPEIMVQTCDVHIL